MLRDFLKVKGKVKDAFKVEESFASNKNGGFKAKIGHWSANWTGDFF